MYDLESFLKQPRLGLARQIIMELEFGKWHNIPYSDLGMSFAVVQFTMIPEMEMYRQLVSEVFAENGWQDVFREFSLADPHEKSTLTHRLEDAFHHTACEAWNTFVKLSEFDYVESYHVEPGFVVHRPLPPEATTGFKLTEHGSELAQQLYHQKSH